MNIISVEGRGSNAISGLEEPREDPFIFRYLFRLADMRGFPVPVRGLPFRREPGASRACRGVPNASFLSVIV